MSDKAIYQTLLTNYGTEPYFSLIVDQVKESLL